MKPEVNEPIGLLAGWGRFPFAVAESLRRQGRSVVGIGILDHTDPQLAELCDQFDWIGLGGIGRAIRKFRGWGVRQAVMAGKVHKVTFYRPGWWLRHRPDWVGLRTYYRQFITGGRDRKDDTLLATLVDAFARGGIRMEPATDFAPELLVAPGMIAGRPLSPKQLRDVEFGWQMAKRLGGVDIGQTVCVKDQAVLALEAIEGTDACIRRAGELCRRGGFTVVKVAKPKQDMRFDVPTVGTGTLESIADAGGCILAIEADRTILLDARIFREAAGRLKIGRGATRRDRLSEGGVGHISPRHALPTMARLCRGALGPLLRLRCVSRCALVESSQRTSSRRRCSAGIDVHGADDRAADELQRRRLVDA